jgi:hypothetical protein
LHCRWLRSRSSYLANNAGQVFSWVFISPIKHVAKVGRIVTFPAVLP